MLLFLLILSFFLQVSAAYLALRLIRTSGGRLAWILIALGFSLRSIRLLYEIYLHLNPEIPYGLLLTDEILGLVISALMAAGVYLIGPLFQAFRLAERERELYTHSISHDLRSPLTVIQGYAELLNQKLGGAVVDEEGRQAMAAILQGSARMNALIQDLTDAARQEGGQLKLERRAVDLGAYLNELVGNAFGQGDRQRLHIIVPPHFPAVLGDPERLFRVFINLLDNALKYSPAAAGVEVEISREGSEALIAVKDQGQGIAARDLPHIFERFYRVKNGRNKGGIGLGLHIARILVQAHNGRIWAESAPGRGSTFFFTLPFADGSGRGRGESP